MNFKFTTQEDPELLIPLQCCFLKQLNHQDFYNKYNTTAVKNLDVHIDAGLLFDLYHL